MRRKRNVHSLAHNKQLNSYTSIEFSPSYTRPSSSKDSILHGASFTEQFGEAAENGAD